MSTDKNPRFIAINDIFKHLIEEGIVDQNGNNLCHVRHIFRTGWKDYLLDRELIKLNDQLPFYWRGRNPYCGMIKDLSDPVQRNRIEENKRKLDIYYKKKDCTK